MEAYVQQKVSDYGCLVFRCLLSFTPGINRVAKKLNIDCASAMIGWEFSGGGAHPVYDGFVVCSEFAEILMDAWNIDQEEKLKKDAEKKEKRVLDNWRKLIKGMLMHQKIRNKYLGKDKQH